MMAEMVLLLILLSGLLVLFLRGVGWFVQFGTGHFCLGHLVFGIRNGLLCLHLLSVLMTLLIGPTLLVFWLSVLPFLGLCIGLLGVQTLGLVVSLSLNCLFFMSFGLVRGCLLKRLILVTSAQDAQFQCRLFRLVQTLIFGVHVVLLVLLCGLFACYLGGWEGLPPAPLVLITADFVILGGRGVAMVLLLGLVKVPLSLS